MFEKISVEEVKDLSQKWEALNIEVEKIIFGQNKIISKLIVGILSNGHILLEGVPGLAKTTLVKTLAKGLGLQFSRIQFTPDLLPSDIIGNQIFNPKENSFFTRKGPVFAGIVLADEINRAPAKVQSALLEAMEEKQVTIANETFFLEKPFIVLATQNPIDQDGTYSLPEAQSDRFMLKLILSYPDKEAEKKMLLSKFEETICSQILTKEDILRSQDAVKRIFIDDKVIMYILDLITTSRPTTSGSRFSNLIRFGASPRAAIFLALGAKARAFLSKRTFVTPDDVKFVATDILRHRLVLSYEAEADNYSIDSIVKAILEAVPTP